MLRLIKKGLQQKLLNLIKKKDLSKVKMKDKQKDILELKSNQITITVERTTKKTTSSNRVNRNLLGLTVQDAERNKIHEKIQTKDNEARGDKKLKGPLS